MARSRSVVGPVLAWALSSPPPPRAAAAPAPSCGWSVSKAEGWHGQCPFVPAAIGAKWSRLGLAVCPQEH